MTRIQILPENPGTSGTTYWAISGNRRSVGSTAGQALDALTAQLGDSGNDALIIVQHMRPDRFFTEDQQKRLEFLMGRWREARDGNGTFSAAEQTELHKLIDAELKAAGERAAAMLHELGA